MARWDGQMYDHKLDPVSGPPPMHRLEYFAKAATGESYVRGSVVSANDDGELVKGVAAGSTAHRPMPMFALVGTEDLDVHTDQYNWGDAVPSALPATGGFELATTEYVVTSGSDFVEYKVNDLLTVTADGKLKKATKDAGNSDGEPIVGIVSIANKGGKVNSIGKATQSNYGKPLLTFWTVFFPCVES